MEHGRMRRGPAPAAKGPDTGQEALVALYRVAYEEARSALASQAEAFATVRQRAIQFVAFIGSATAFLVGTGLADWRTKVRPDWFGTAAWWAIACDIALGAALLMILAPIKRHDRVSARRLIEDWVDVQIVVTEWDMLRELALYHDDTMVSQRWRLRILQSALSVLVIAGVAQVVLWAVLVANVH